MKQHKRRGRPPKPAEPGTRISLGLKVTPEIKTKLDKVARASGRTQSQEAELRLERSFDREELLPEVLTLAFGRPLASLLAAVGEAIKLVGPLSKYSARFSPNGEVVIDRANWNDNIGTRRQALNAGILLLRIFREPWSDLARDFSVLTPAKLEELLMEYGEQACGAVFVTLQSLRGELSSELDRDWKPIREEWPEVVEDLLRHKNPEQGEIKDAR